MYVKNLIKAYDENYGFINRLKKNILYNKCILFPNSLIILSPIGFLIVYFCNINFVLKTLLMLVLLLLYIGGIIWTNWIIRKNIKRFYNNYEEYEKDKLNKFHKYIEENLKIRSFEQYTLLDTLVLREIEELKELKNFPFKNTIKQLGIAVLITGLLSYSFHELRSGNIDLALQLIHLYILIIGNIIMIGVVIYLLSGYTRESKLKKIRKIITEIQLNISIKDFKK